MRKKTMPLALCSALLLLFVSNVKAQDENNPKGYIALNGGVGLPIGDYNQSGFAVTGYNIHLSTAIPLFHSKFGIASKFDYGSNSYDGGSLLATIVKNDKFTYVAQSGNYTYTTLLAGIFYTIPLKKISFDFRVMGGMMSMNFPSIAVGATDSSNTTVAVGKGDGSGSAFAYNVGLGMRYSITPKLCLMVNFDYLGSSISYDAKLGALVIDSNGQYAISTTNSNFSQSVSLLNATAGIGWQFGSKK